MNPFKRNRISKVLVQLTFQCLSVPVLEGTELSNVINNMLVNHLELDGCCCIEAPIHYRSIIRAHVCRKQWLCCAASCKQGLAAGLVSVLWSIISKGAVLNLFLQVYKWSWVHRDQTAPRVDTLPNLRSRASKQETDFPSPIPKTPFFCNLFQSHAFTEAATNLKVSTILTSWSFPVLFLFVARCCPSFRSAERFQSRWWQLTKLLSLTFWCKFSN